MINEFWDRTKDGSLQAAEFKDFSKQVEFLEQYRRFKWTVAEFKALFELGPYGAFPARDWHHSGVEENRKALIEAIEKLNPEERNELIVNVIFGLVKAMDTWAS